jgi:hypothetical protein
MNFCQLYIPILQNSISLVLLRSIEISNKLIKSNPFISFDQVY